MNIPLQNKRIIVLFALIAFFLLLVWFRNGAMVGGTEAAIYFYNPSIVQSKYYESWNPLSLGFANGHATLSGTIHWGPFMILEKIGFSPFFIQLIVYFQIIFCSLLGMYLLIKYLFKKEQHIEQLAFISALLYFFNILAMQLIWFRLQYPYKLYYAMLPGALYIFIKGINEKKYMYIIYLNLYLLLFGTTFFVPAFVVMFWFINGVYLLFFLSISTSWNRKISAILFIFASISLWLVLNFWWIDQLMNVYNLSGYYGKEFTQNNIKNFASASLQAGGMSGILGFKHYDIFNHLSGVWGWFYSSILFILIRYAVFAIIIAAIFLRKKPKNLWFFIILALSIILIMAGAAGPFGSTALFIFSRFSFLEGFRHSFEKAGISFALSASPLIAYTLVRISFLIKEKYGSKIFKGWIWLCITVFLVLTYPIWTGLIFYSTSPGFTGDQILEYYVKVPNYYKEANEFLNQDKGYFRVIALPISPEGITQKWEHGYRGIELSFQLFDKSFVSSISGPPFIPQIASQIEDVVLNSPDKLYQLMQILNAKYIMIRDDIETKLPSGNLSPPDKIRKILDKNKYLTHIKDFGKLSFYKLKDDKFKNKVYISNNVYVLPSYKEEMYDKYALAKYFSKNNYEFPTVLITKDEAKNIDGTFFHKDLKDRLPGISFNKINNATYEVEIKDAQSPFLLVFGESFNPMWEAWINNKKIDSKSHFLANFYENAWQINEKGNFKIKIIFGTQERLEISRGVFFIVLILLVVLIFIKNINLLKGLF